ncbi:MAG: diguanylate cyclase [Nostoc sp. LLA-1]|nr:diguanylate cyclase [Cyanocohniella sp. LLY]
MLPRKILVVEDEKVLALNIRNSLQNLGYNVPKITIYGEEAIKNVSEIQPHLVLIDIDLLGIIDGVHVADNIQNYFHTPVLYLVECLEYIKSPNNRLSESLSYILKPFTEIDLHLAVEMAIYKHQVNQKMQSEKQRMGSIIDSMPCAVVVTYTSGRVQMMNPMAEVLTGWKQDEAFGRDLSEVVNLVDKDMDEAINNLVTQVMEVGEVLNLPENCMLIAKDGREIAIGDNIAPIRDRNGQITGAVLVFHDISQRKQMEAQLLRNAFYDGLTALPNRVLFLDRLKHAIQRQKRRHEYRFAVLFLDLDGFKEINDRFGHGMGDDFLVAIASRLESCVRGGDTVGRFGGDEFAVLLEEIKDVTDTTNVAKRIQDTLGLPINLNGHQICTTVSIGIALNNGDDDEPETLVRDADIAMYRAKKQGKARYSVFDAATNS